jgi:cutinase
MRLDSQGAQLVHNAAWLLQSKSSPALSHVKAAVVFGDPDNGKPLPPPLDSKTRTYCNSNDKVCFGGWVQTEGHLTYNLFAMDAAVWVKRQVETL